MATQKSRRAVGAGTVAATKAAVAKAAAAAAAAAEAKTPGAISFVAAADAFKGRNITVRVPRLGDNGEPLREKDGSRFLVEDLPLAAELILSAREREGVVSVVTIDGQRHTSE